MSIVTVQLLASQDDLLMVMAAALVHEVFHDTDAIPVINRAVNVTCTDPASTRHRICTECQSVDHVTCLGYLLGRNLTNWLTDFTRTETS